jgi:penicillin-binding protein 1A
MKIFSWKGEIDTLMTPYDSIKYYKQFLKTGILSVEPQTGHVKAWVGGINHKHFKWDAVKQQERQVGSTFKPFVYATAINQLKYSPCRKIENTPFIMPKGRFGIPEDWVVHNSGEKYGEPRTMKNALANSINVVSARLIDAVSPSNVVKLARSMGVTSKTLEANPSIALGAVELSLYDMIGALSTFVNKGMYIKPIMVLRIEDKNGTVLESFTPKTREVLSKESAYTIVNLMEGVTKAGTGMRLRTSGKYPKTITGHPYKFTNPIAGKTGTSQNQSDGWFMGMVPNLATGVWVGADDRAVHFPDVGRGQGASMALPIWALYYKRLYADKSLKVSDKAFPKPANLSIELDCDKAEEELPKDGEPTDKPTEEEDEDDGF